MTTQMKDTIKISNDMKNNYEDELKKIRYREERVATETKALNDYKRNVLRKIIELQGWEKLLNPPYKNTYADNAEELLANTNIIIDVDNKGVLRVYDGKLGHVNTHEIMSFNLHHSIDEEFEHRRNQQAYYDKLAKMSRCGRCGI